MPNEPEQPWPNRSSVPWGAWPVILVILFYDYSPYLVSGALWSWERLAPTSYKNTYEQLYHSHPYGLPEAVDLALMLLVILIAWNVLRKSGKGFRDAGLVTGGRLYHWYYLALGLAICGYAYSVSRSMFYFVLLLIVIAPFVEELLFRGMLFPVLARRTTPLRAALVSGVFFGLGGPGHFEQGVFALVSLAIMGTILAYLYIKTRNLWFTILVHAVNNTHFLLVMGYLWR